MSGVIELGGKAFRLPPPPTAPILVPGPGLDRGARAMRQIVFGIAWLLVATSCGSHAAEPGGPWTLDGAAPPAGDLATRVPDQDAAADLTAPGDAPVPSADAAAVDAPAPPELPDAASDAGPADGAGDAPRAPDAPSDLAVGGDGSQPADAGPGADAALSDAAADTAGLDVAPPCMPATCNDGNPCTADACTPSGCSHLPVPGPCDDGDACTSGDACADGKCKGSVACYPSLTFTGGATAGQPVTAVAKDKTGWVDVGMTCQGPCGSVAGVWGGVQSQPDGSFAWTWTVTPTSGGPWTCAFTANNGTKSIATAKLQVAGNSTCSVCPKAGVACQDTYPAQLACPATGKIASVVCHKFGTCTGIGGGPLCSWGTGSWCDDPCGAVCGNGKCESGESCGGCPVDCACPGVVGTAGGDFVLDGKPWHFIGVNVRGLVHYGGKDLMPWAGTADQDLTLQVAQAMGAKVVRVFAANHKLDAAACAQRLKTLLDKAQAHGLRLIVVLTDGYPTGFSPPGDDGFYAKDAAGFDVLQQGWFAGGWKQNWLPYAKALIAAGKGHPALLAWEVGNELKWPPDPALFVQFAQQAAAELHAADPGHLVALGLISSASAALSSAQAQVLAADPHISFLTLHVYDGATEADDALAKAVGKPLVVEEAGFSGAARGPKVDADVANWAAKGARGYLQWGFMPASADNGDGDATYGMDKVLGPHKDDWDALFAVYAGWAAKL
jgi:hypothetical protein